MTWNDMYDLPRRHTEMLIQAHWKHDLEQAGLTQRQFDYRFSAKIATMTDAEKAVIFDDLLERSEEARRMVRYIVLGELESRS